MRARSMTRADAAVVFLAALVAGCSTTLEGIASLPVSSSESTQRTASTPGRPAIRTTHGRPAVRYETLHSFGSGSDGAEPVAGLIDVNGTLYGTTDFGGAHNAGTVYDISKSGGETVLHSFRGRHEGDGAYPQAGLRLVNGKLYGTTWLGGDYNHGTVYSIGAFGAETVVHSFDPGSGDGSNPVASLRDVNGTIYGTTLNGGNTGGGNSGGTVYSITPTGTESVLYTFGGGYDGTNPEAGLRDVSGTLYGTTSLGGDFGDGTVYSITTSGTETVLHSFGLHSDGAWPWAGLRDMNGRLYGTTLYGGVYGAGTVYSITASGKETVVHSFGSGYGSGSDGANPQASLRDVNGTLYGTTSNGGAHGGGTIYSITVSGTEKVLYSFGSASDGKTPKANLLEVGGTLYGTTSLGGAHGRGTVFSFIP